MVYLSRIYTKTGDRGDTALGDGQRVVKDHPRVEAYGQVDELNAVLGLVAAYCPDAPEAALLRSVQNDLFDVGADLCVPQPEGEQPGPGLRVTAAQAERLERAIDRLNEGLDPLRSFVLPGGTPAAAWLHLARTVCRRAERRVVTLAGENPDGFENVLTYLNRLGDYLFVAARAANHVVGGAEIPWTKPG